ncbi:hypothetical protein ACWGPQ_22090 [Saccharomonospora azurea]
MTKSNTGDYPHRIVDSQQHGWLSRGDGIYEGYDPSEQLGDGRLEPRPLAEIEAQFGQWRPVVPPTADELEELHAAYEAAGNRAIGSAASAIALVYHQARNRFGPWNADIDGTAAYAHRTLTAGRPGSWEAAAIMDVVAFGEELNYPVASDASAAEAGPDPERVHQEARDRIAAVVRAWTLSEDRYTEVPATLSRSVAAYADERHGVEGWRAIADEWLQPGSPDRENVIGTYRLLYDASAHFDPSAITA